MRTKPPTVTLQTKAETLAFLAEHDETYFELDGCVKSQWLCDQLDRFEQEGFVYNRQAQERIARENGMSYEDTARRNPAKTMKTEGGLLGYLIYLAQGYRKEDRLAREGWVRASQMTLAPFSGRKCAALNNGALSGQIIAQVKTFDGRLRLCPVNTRTKAYAEYEDWWIKPAETLPPPETKTRKQQTKLCEPMH
jgi:hypothetical protein